MYRIRKEKGGITMAELKEGQNLQDEIVAAVDTGARAPIGWEAKFIATTTFVWALFQLYIASNLPFWLTDVTGISLVVTNSNARLIHLAFGLFLAALAFPLFKKSSKTRVRKRRYPGTTGYWALRVWPVASISSCYAMKSRYVRACRPRVT
jgi:TRAP-type uncharacterized transport system fused permease subunit